MAKISVEQIAELIAQGCKGRITGELLQAFLENPNRFLSEKDDWLTVNVDYSKSFEQTIAAGRYDRKNKNVTSENFPEFDSVRELMPSPREEVKVRLVCLNRAATTKEIETHLDSLGLKAAKIEHLLAFGEKFHGLQQEYPIVALGSVWAVHDDESFVPYIVRRSSERGLGSHLDYPAHTWYGYFRFLAIEK